MKLVATWYETGSVKMHLFYSCIYQYFQKKKESNYTYMYLQFHQYRMV